MMKFSTPLVVSTLLTTISFWPNCFAQDEPFQPVPSVPAGADEFGESIKLDETPTGLTAVPALSPICDCLIRVALSLWSKSTADVAPEADGIAAAATRAEEEANRARRAAKSATEAAAVANAKAAAKEAFLAARQAFRVADAARIAPPSVAEARAKAAMAIAEVATKAAEKAEAAAVAAGGPARKLKAKEAEATKKEAEYRSNFVINQLQIVSKSASPIKERQRAIKAISSVAGKHGELNWNGGDVCLASAAVAELYNLSDEPVLAETVIDGLGDILEASAKNLVKLEHSIIDENGHPVNDDQNRPLVLSAFQLGTNALFQAMQAPSTRTQRVAANVTVDLLKSATTTKGDYVHDAFRDVNVLATDIVLKHSDSRIRLGVLKTLIAKGAAILKQQADMSTAAAAKKNADVLKAKLNTATASHETAKNVAASKEGSFETAKNAVTESDRNVVQLIVSLAELDIKVRELENAMPQDAAMIATTKASRDEAREGLARMKEAKAEQEKNLADAAKAMNEAKADSTKKETAKNGAKTAYATAKADADSKSKAKGVDSRALEIVVNSLETISLKSGLPDRIAMETSYALNLFIQGKPLPPRLDRKFATSSVDTTGQPLAASGRSGVASIESGRIGIAATRQFDSERDITNRAIRGSRVDAGPQSLRKQRAEDSTPTTRTVTGATRVTGTPFVPAQIVPTSPPATTP